MSKFVVAFPHNRKGPLPVVIEAADAAEAERAAAKVFCQRYQDTERPALMVVQADDRDNIGYAATVDGKLIRVGSAHTHKPWSRAIQHKTEAILTINTGKSQGLFPSQYDRVSVQAAHESEFIAQALPEKGSWREVDTGPQPPPKGKGGKGKKDDKKDEDKRSAHGYAEVDTGQPPAKPEEAKPAPEPAPEPEKEPETSEQPAPEPEADKPKPSANKPKPSSRGGRGGRRADGLEDDMGEIGGDDSLVVPTHEEPQPGQPLDFG